jgi:hypothetical protein
LRRLDRREGALEPIVLARVVEGRVGGPDALDDIQIFAGPGVAPIMVKIVAVAALLGVIAAGDDVNGRPAVGIGVQRGQGAGGQGRRDKPRAAGEQFRACATAAG